MPIFSKTVILPGGGRSGEPLVDLPPPVVGKRFPVYVWANLIVQYPISLFLATLCLPFLMAVLPNSSGPNQSTDASIVAYSLSQGYIQGSVYDRMQRAMTAALENQQDQEFTNSIARFYVGVLCPDTGQLVSDWKEWVGDGLRYSISSRLWLIYEPKRIKSTINPVTGLKKPERTILHRDMLKEILYVENTLKPILEKAEMGIVSDRHNQGKTWTPLKMDPLVSLMTYFAPGGKIEAYTKDCNKNSTWAMDGSGGPYTMHHVNVCQHCGIDFCDEPIVRSDPGVGRDGQGIPGVPLDRWPCENVSNHVIGLWRNSELGHRFALEIAPERLTDMLTEVRKNPHWRWFLGREASLVDQRAARMRTQISLSFTSDLTYAQQSAAIKVIADFVKQLSSHLKDVSVHVGGELITQEAYTSARNKDRVLTILGLSFCLVAVSYHCHSLFIGFFVVSSPIIIFTASQWIYFYVLCKDLNGHLLNTPAMMHLVMIGFTTSSTLIFYTRFIQSGSMASHGHVNLLTLAQRLSWVYRKAGIAVAISSVIVFLILLLNTFSPIPSVRDFSTILAIEVVLNCYIFLTVFPCAVIFHHKHISGKRRNAQRLREFKIKIEHETAIHRSAALNTFYDELFLLSPGIERPHMRDEGSPTTNVKPFHSASDFRKSRRKQPDEYIARLNEDTAWEISQQQLDVIIAPFEDVYKRPGAADINTSHAMFWDALDDKDKSKALLGIADKVGLQGRNARRATLMEVVHDTVSSSISGPIINQVSNRADAALDPAKMGISLTGHFRRGDNNDWFSRLVERLPQAGAKRIKRSTFWRWMQKRYGRGETATEKLLRLQAAPTKREGYTAMERFFFNFIGNLILRFWWLLASLGLLMIILAGILGHINSFSAAANDSPLFTSGSEVTQFERLKELMDSDLEDCDFCSAWHRDNSNLPQGCEITLEDGTKFWKITGKVDDCGVCDGNNECKGCDGLGNQSSFWPNFKNPILALPGNDCPDGSRSTISEEECNVYSPSIRQQWSNSSPQTEVRIEVGSWSSLPPGCSLRTQGTKQPRPYFNRKNGWGVGFNPICTGDKCVKSTDSNKCPCGKHGYCTSKYDPEAADAAFFTCVCKGQWSGPICTKCNCDGSSYCDEIGRCRPCLFDRCGVCFGNNECLENKLEDKKVFGGCMRTDPDPSIGPSPSSNSNETTPEDEYLAGLEEASCNFRNSQRNLSRVEMWFGLKPEYPNYRYKTEEEFEPQDGPDIVLSIKEPYYDTRFSLEDPQAQIFLLAVCEALWVKSSIVESAGVCIMQDWKYYLQSKGLPFPYTEQIASKFLQEFTTFVEANGLQNYAGIKKTKGQPTKIQWLRLEFYQDREGVSANELETRHELWMSQVKQLAEHPMCPDSCRPQFVYSKDFQQAYYRIHLMQSGLVTIILGIIIGSLLIQGFTSSITLTIIYTLTMGIGVSAALLGFMVMNWEFGLIESLGLTILVGSMSSMSIHTLEGYIEFLHSTHSTLLAPKTTRGSCVRGVLLRTGVPLTTSAVIVMVASLLLMASGRFAVQRTGHIMFITSITGTVTTILFINALCAKVGPLKIVRTRTSFAISFTVILIAMSLTLLILWASKAPIRWPTGDLIFSSEAPASDIVETIMSQSLNP